MLVYLGCPLPAHDTLSGLLAGSVAQQVNEASNSSTTWDHLGGIRSANYRDLYNCTLELVKIPDSTIGVASVAYKQQYPKSPPMVVEVSLFNEHFDLLMREGSNWCSLYTDTAVAIMAKVNVTPARKVQVVHLVIYGRIYPRRGDLPQNRSGPGYDCVIRGKDNELTADQFYERSPVQIKREFRVSLLFRGYVDRESIAAGQRVQFELPTTHLALRNERLFAVKSITINLTESFGRFLNDYFPQQQIIEI